MRFQITSSNIKQKNWRTNSYEQKTDKSFIRHKTRQVCRVLWLVWNVCLDFCIFSGQFWLVGRSRSYLSTHKPYWWSRLTHSRRIKRRNPVSDTKLFLGNNWCCCYCEAILLAVDWCRKATHQKNLSSQKPKTLRSSSAGWVGGDPPKISVLGFGAKMGSSVGVKTYQLRKFFNQSPESIGDCFNITMSIYQLCLELQNCPSKVLRLTE